MNPQEIHNLMDLDGGFKAISDQTELKMTDYICSTTTEGK